MVNNIFLLKITDFWVEKLIKPRKPPKNGPKTIQCDKSASAISRGFASRLRGQILAWGSIISSFR